jgi:hypothetical protein
MLMSFGKASAIEALSLETLLPRCCVYRRVGEVVDRVIILAIISCYLILSKIDTLIMHKAELHVMNPSETPQTLG